MNGWWAAVVGLAGIAATLAGALGGPALAARRARDEWLRQQRVDLYREAMLHAHLMAVGAAHATDETVDWHRYTRGGAATLTPADEVSARMDLLAHTEVADAWRVLTEAQESLEWHVMEEIGDPFGELTDDNPHVVRVRQAVEAFQLICRSAVVRRSSTAG
jgi:hypothetical protein